ncbi:transposase (plasmid) [Streptomyces viridifaciens]|nr:transposase [Streptomyces viridifaciens]
MPADFPARDRVYAFFRRWRDKGLVAEFHDRLRDRVREAADRDLEPTAGIIDAQSVKGAASVPATSRGFDGGKKLNGRKRHIVVDTLGLLLAVMVTAPSVTDRETGRTLLERLRERHWRISLVWADGGYTGRLVDLARGSRPAQASQWAWDRAGPFSRPSEPTRSGSSASDTSPEVRLSRGLT